jgi:hypothetical protein
LRNPVVRDILVNKVASMQISGDKIYKKWAYAALFFFFFTGLSLFPFRDTVMAGADVPHSHGAGSRHHAHSLKTAEAVLDIETTPKHISAHIPATLRFSLKDHAGKPLSGITVSHERILHVIVVSQDFTVFAHLHPEDFGAVTPEMIRDARFSVNYSFPKAGRYLIALDSAVQDLHFSKQLFIDVAGEPSMAVAVTDFSRTKKSGDYVIRLTVPEHIKAGQETTLGYFIEKDGKPVADLEPYLAALMHLAVIKADLRNFIHAHGEAPGFPSAHSAGHIHGTALHGFGPLIEATVIFPVKGVYRVFSEIKHQGKVIVTSFMVNIE